MQKKSMSGRGVIEALSHNLLYRLRKIA